MRIALDLRARLKALTPPDGTVVKRRRSAAGSAGAGDAAGRNLRAGFRDPPRGRGRARRRSSTSVPFIVDVDDSFGQPRPAPARLRIDQDRLEYFGGRAARCLRHRSRRCSAEFRSAIRIAGRAATRSRSPSRLPKSDLALEPGTGIDAGAGQRPAGHAAWSSSARSCERRRKTARRPIFRRDGRFADMVMAELAGALRGADLRHAGSRRTASTHTTGASCQSRRSACTASRSTRATPTLLWDGEWEITYVTFRDMGAAFVVAMLGIYVLVVGAVRQLPLPLVILTPIPLTLIGIVLGPLAVRCAVHRDIDDRLHRAGRNYRAQLDPAGRFHSPCGRPRQDRCATCCWKRALSASSRSC